MDPILFAVGTGIQMAGQYQANLEQAAYERANAKFYQAQKDLAVTAYQANLDKEQIQYNYQKGRMVSAAAGGGADVGSGSALLMQAGITARHLTTLSRIKEQSMLDIQLAGARARRSERMSNTLESPGYNLLQAGTTALNAYSTYQGVIKPEGSTPDFRGNISTPALPDAGALQMPAHYSPFLSATS